MGELNHEDRAFFSFFNRQVPGRLARFTENIAVHPLSITSLHELQILPAHPDEPSLLALVNKAKTYPGKDRLIDLLRLPLRSVAQIRQRQLLFQFLSQHLAKLNVDVAPGYLTAAHSHLLSSLAWSAAPTALQRLGQDQWLRWAHSLSHYQLRSGTAALQLVLRTIEQRTAGWRTLASLPDDLKGLAQQLNTALIPLLALLHQPLNRTTLLKVDYQFRHQYIDQVRVVLDSFYLLDAYCGLARFLATVTWTYPDFSSSPTAAFTAVSLHHPLLASRQVTGNPVSFADPHRLVVLTGGNMSGKTTFLKACGVAVYLAHLGFPVPAQSMRLSFFDRLLTSIHRSDKLALGYSHFYPELMHIKAAAQYVAGQQRLFLIADELFSSTNPADALLCTRRVMDKFLARSGHLVMLSSHLPNLHPFYEGNPRILFQCFTTQVVDGQLVFTHQLKPGVAIEQTGLLLLEQTGTLASLT